MKNEVKKLISEKVIATLDSENLSNEDKRKVLSYTYREVNSKIKKKSE